MDTSNITIKTDRLILKGISLDYKDEIFKEFTPEIVFYMFPKSPDKIEETIEFVETSVDKNKAGSDFATVIIDKKNGEFIGCGGLHHIDSSTPELGIWIKKSSHGQGYGKEAIVALKGWADKNIKYEYILYPVVDENIPSRKIPEFLGCKIEREYDKLSLNGRKHHLVEYRIYPLK